MAFGKYTVNETYIPSPEILKVEEFYVTINKDSNIPIKELVANDSPFEAYLKLQKKDKNTGKFVTYSNATFSLLKFNEENDKWEKVQCKVGNQYFDKWTTNSEGIARTENKLESGKYKLTELVIPEGFIELDEDVIFDVNNKNETLEYDDDYDAWITVTAENEQPLGKLQLNKKINLRDDADTSLIKDIDFTQISFELIAKDNIIDYADGSIIYNANQIIGKYNLDKDGKLIIDDIPMGKYIIRECSTILGAVLDNKEYDVIFTKMDNSTKKYLVELNIENNTTLVEVSKKDITGNDELIGAKLKVLDENNEIIDSWFSTNKPHKIEGLEVGKKYKLQEEISIDSYVKATEIEFEVKNNSEIQKVVMIDKIVEILKVDNNGNAVEGVELQVLDKEGNIVDSWTTTKEAHRVSGLEEGKEYILHENKPIQGYVKATDEKFTVSLDKETQEISMIDKTVVVKKTDFVTGEEVIGAELEIIDEQGNVIDSWTSTEEEHYVSGLEENKKYTLIEKISPYSYEKAENIEFFVSSDNKETQLIEMKDKPILSSIKVVKIDSETKEIIKDKFTFGLYEDFECTKLIKEVESNPDEGTVTFDNIRFGVFLIKEISCPKGYTLSDEVAVVEISDDGVFINGTKIDKENGFYSFEYYNKPIPTIQTGNETNYKMLGILAIISLIGIIGSMIILKRKNKKNK